MFGQLLIKECRQTAKSLIYWLIVLVLIFVFATQIGEMDILTEPQKGQADYGYKASSDEADIMKFTLGALVQEYMRGSYTTYPIGFYKSVTLNEKEERQIREIVRETTGISSQEEAEEIMESWYEAQRPAAGDGQETMMKNLEIAPASGLSYDRFTELMDQADAILGGGSSYGKSYRSSNAQVPKTYEDAITEYRELTEKDRLTGGYARLFSDYMGIFLGLLPVFLTVTRELRDRRSGMQELICSRKCSSLVIIASRYVSMVVMLILPVLLISLPLFSRCMKYASGAGISADAFAFVKYTFGWLTPTIMTAAAVGMFFTELTDTALGVLVQGVWWFFATFGGVNTLHGGMYGWNLIPRHNTELNWSGYQSAFAQLAANRILYVLLSLVLVALTILIYDQKRKGRYRLSWKNIGRLKKSI